MREGDYDEFAGMLADVWALKTQVLTGSQKAMYFRALAGHSLDAVRSGLDAHVKDPDRGRFLPMPADVIAKIQASAADDGRPGAEEAWAVALRGVDEQATVVWTDETSRAWAVARTVLDAGDEVGARMAFKEVYSRLVDEARCARRAPQWTASLGFDVALREQALVEASRLRQLPAPEHIALPAQEVSLGALTDEAPQHIIEKLRGLRDQIAGKRAGPSIDQIERERTDLLKEQTAEKVAAYEDSHAR